jgi:hypothetical protein
LFEDHEGAGVRRKEKSISALRLLREFIILNDALCLFFITKQRVYIGE